MNKAFRREVSLFYAEQNEVDGVEPEEMKDLAVYRIVKDHVEELAKAETVEASKKSGEKLQPFECSPDDGGCGEIVREVDPFCWCCGISQTGKKKDSFESVAKVSGKEKPEVEPEEKSEEKSAAKPKKKPAKVPDEVVTKEEQEEEEQGVTAAEESLEVFTGRIREALSDTGRNAWGIGRDLNAVSNAKLYKQKGHESFKDWFADEFRNIELTTAKAFMKIAKTFEEDECAQIGSSKLNVIKNADPKDRPKLLKAAHKGATVSELRDEVRESREKKGGKKKGPPPVSMFKKTVGQTYKGKFTNKKKSVAECKLDDLGVSAVVTMQATGVKLEFVKTYVE